MASAIIDDKSLAIAQTLFASGKRFDSAAIADARYMMEAIHGEKAAMTAVAIACDRLLGERLDESRFWMRVYRSIIGADTADADSMAIH
ncbi:hypothetical protein [Acuticoccus yangtzensis]|uniref:hypothetical protein n=1 Tax=Acuticoccus yangtzensis TaxID=1443441 RepID=UPI0009498E78|nr:hypothetical protein [Acuticoccus yangtzensis]ORE92476.1 hypothetical protein ATO13_16184 [Stappia sp. 22II-S9-Z10]